MISIVVMFGYVTTTIHNSISINIMCIIVVSSVIMIIMIIIITIMMRISSSTIVNML